ncbi:hypothetical protein EJ03DRAFT_328053 [Teratosphaeria nubilosa]|uniref:Uncharacterized protein n=1 Tax=Teratosphaeria nubilosa TaxID=161662 RepID=A0A6G1L857_9PEZI|nr:hypothetical protein EJ03DRAFT_328053 [Teratosphaeria nubilosa]
MSLTQAHHQIKPREPVFGSFCCQLNIASQPLTPKTADDSTLICQPGTVARHRVNPPSSPARARSTKHPHTADTASTRPPAP